MNNDFEAVTVYRCRFCRKIFMTDKRHTCKFNPEAKNCFSCRNCMELKENKDKDREHFSDIEVCCKKGLRTGLAEMASLNWQLGCNSWQIRPDYKGKESYLRDVPRLEIWGAGIEQGSEEEV